MTGPLLRAGVVLLLAVAPAAGADLWTVSKEARQSSDGEWSTTCAALWNQAPDGLTSFALIASEFTALRRLARGDPDPWDPVVYAGFDVTGGKARTPAAEPYGWSIEGEKEPGDAEWWFGRVDAEYRFHYGVNEEGRAPHTAWVASYSNRAVDYDGQVIRDESSVFFLWIDFPPELFRTNDTTALRLAFGGLTRSRGVDLFRRTRAHFSFRHALQAFEDVEQCLEDHRRADRLDTPPLTTAGLLGRAGGQPLTPW